jgi:WD40 repeat protein
LGSFSSGIVEVLGLISNFIRIAQRQAQFSPGGERVVTAFLDGTARIWNPKTSQLLAVLNAQGGGVFDAVITADGAQVATASEDWTARIWNIEISDAFTAACDRLGNKGDLTGLARRYGLTELKPICGSNGPIKALSVIC